MARGRLPLAVGRVLLAGWVAAEVRPPDRAPAVVEGAGEVARQVGWVGEPRIEINSRLVMNKLFNTSLLRETMI